MKIACLMMQKNETSLLDTWITYHGTLFGFNNIFVFDNGSEDKTIDAIYQKHIPSGISIQRSFTKKSDFYNKGHVLGGYIKFLDSADNYDFIMPLDCDEFLAVQLENGEVKCDVRSIEFELSKFKDTVHPLSIKGSYFNIPQRHEMFYFYPESKMFFGSKTFEFMDEGFHVARTRLSNTSIQTNIVHFHYSNKPFDMGQRHAKEKLSGLINDFSKENMANYSGPGDHLKRFFIHSEEEYKNSLMSAGIILPNFKIRLNEVGLKIPFSEYWMGVDSESRPPEQRQKPKSGCFYWSNGICYELD